MLTQKYFWRILSLLSLEEPEPGPETPRTGEDAAATAAREARNRLLRDRVAAENEERREKGPKVGHNIYYNEVKKRLVSRQFLAFGTEGKKRFVQKNPHAKILNWNLRNWSDWRRFLPKNARVILMSDTNCLKDPKKLGKRWKRFMPH